eukprot:3562008-Lingulodinium_polyedra.AAC.1
MAGSPAGCHGGHSRSLPSKRHGCPPPRGRAGARQGAAVDAAGAIATYDDTRAQEFELEASSHAC